MQRAIWSRNPTPEHLLRQKYIWKDTCTPPPGLFSVAKKCEQPNCPSTNEWIKKMCVCVHIYTHTVEHSSAIKRMK